MHLSYLDPSLSLRLSKNTFGSPEDHRRSLIRGRESHSLLFENRSSGATRETIDESIDSLRMTDMEMTRR